MVIPEGEIRDGGASAGVIIESDRDSCGRERLGEARARALVASRCGRRPTARLYFRDVATKSTPTVGVWPRPGWYGRCGRDRDG